MHLELYRLFIYCSLSQGHGRTSQRILIFAFSVSSSPSSFLHVWFTCSLFSASFILWFLHFLPDLPICSFLYLLNPFLLYPTVSRLLFSFDHFTDRNTQRTNDQLVATQTQNKHIHIQNIHPLCGMRTHDPGFRANEESACFRHLGHRDRHVLSHRSYKWKLV
jgi:hypothetical protein